MGKSINILPMFTDIVVDAVNLWVLLVLSGGLIRFSLGDSYFYLGQIEQAIKETETALSSLQEGFAVTSVTGKYDQG